MALTFGFYVHEDAARPLAIAAVVAFTLVNVRGVEKTARVSTILVIAVLSTLAVPVVSLLGLDEISPSRAFPSAAPPGGLALLHSAALLFFAFAGYARIATLGEEVERPEQTIPRAIPIALGLVLAIYAAIIAAALMALTPDGLAESKAPLVDAVKATDFDALAPIVRVGATLATLSVLLSLLAGVSRTTFAMARERDLPAWLDAVHPVYRVPHRAELTIGAVVALLAGTLDLRSAIGFSSFAVLVYYAIANAAALTLVDAERRWPRWTALLGMLGCGALAISLPGTTLASGAALFAVGMALYLLRRKLRRV
jgi:APA family basic amino acid/polyamine antiporter